MRRLAACTALLVLFSTAPGAESLWVTDRLLLGIHEDSSLGSTIVKVVASGVKLEVLDRDGELARVRAEDGTTGWIDAGYLTAQTPATLLAREAVE